jgi:hypothetical protein
MSLLIVPVVLGLTNTPTDILVVEAV